MGLLPLSITRVLTSNSTGMPPSSSKGKVQSTVVHGAYACNVLSITEDMKLLSIAARVYETQRFPIITWRHGRTLNALLRSGAPKDGGKTSKNDDLMTKIINVLPPH